MTFWDRLKRVWVERHRKPTPTEIESLHQELRWSRARLAVRQMPEYLVFVEWLEEMMFTYYEKLKGDPSGVLQNIYSAEMVDFILSKIESSTPEQIEIDGKNLETLRSK